MCLVFAFVAFVAFVGSFATSAFYAGSVTGSGVALRVGILSKFYIRNNLLLKLWRTFSLAINDNPNSFKKKNFQVFLYLSQINSIAKLLCLRLAFSNDKFPSSISLKKTIGA